MNGPWMLTGDFNCVISQDEKGGGNHINLNGLNDFNRMISCLGLVDSGFFGKKYTWCNSRIGNARILKRLNRALLNPLWVAACTTELSHLHRTCSDHSPLLLKFGQVSRAGSFFRFINAWTKHHQVLDLVKSSWECNLPGKPLVRFAMKLKRLKQRLKDWNKEVYGNIHQEVKDAEDEAIKMEAIWDSSPFEANKINFCMAQERLNAKLEIEEMFWKQKANVKRLKDGDKNTKFFHHTVQQRRQKLHIHRIRRDDEEWVQET